MKSVISGPEYIWNVHTYVCALGWFKKTNFWGKQLLFHFVNLYVEKKDSQKGWGLYDDI